MLIVSDINLIVQDQLRPFRVSAGNRWDPLHAAIHFGLPIAGAIILASLGSGYAALQAENLLTVYGLVATALTAAMSTIHGLSSSVSVRRINQLKGKEPNEKRLREAQRLIARMESIRGLFASIGWSVLVLVTSGVPLLLMLITKTENDTLLQGWGWSMFRWMLASMIYYAGITAAVGFLDIVGGVHSMMTDETSDLEDALADLRESYKL